jgi:hypothetical protein
MMGVRVGLGHCGTVVSLETVRSFPSGVLCLRYRVGLVHRWEETDSNLGRSVKPGFADSTRQRAAMTLLLAVRVAVPALRSISR